MCVYRISKWNEVFERAESRRLQKLNWVAMPVGFTSAGYQAMLDTFSERAPGYLWCWCALVAVAATVLAVVCWPQARAWRSSRGI